MDKRESTNTLLHLQVVVPAMRCKKNTYWYVWKILIAFSHLPMLATHSFRPWSQFQENICGCSTILEYIGHQASGNYLAFNFPHHVLFQCQVRFGGKAELATESDSR